MKVFQKRLFVGLVVMALLSPVGILLPKMLNSGDAWGEWSADKIGRLIGYVPDGMRKLAGIWKAPISDYNPGGENASMAAQMIYYIISGCIGIIIAAGVVYLISRLLLKSGK